MQQALDAAGAANDVKLLTDMTLSAALTVASGKTVTLDLNGHTIDRGLAGKSAVDRGYVIYTEGTLTLTDNSAGKTGKITGGNNTGEGGGVYCYCIDLPSAAARSSAIMSRAAQRAPEASTPAARRAMSRWKQTIAGARSSTFCSRPR